MVGRSLCSVLSKCHRTLSTASFRLSKCSLRSIHTLPDIKISPKISPRLSPMVPRCLSTSVSRKFNPALEWGLDYQHWLISVEEPNPDMTRDQIIDMYVKLLASVVGSEEEARMKIYSVSTKYYYAFGMPKVVRVNPDCYVGPTKNKDYGGEPFIDGQPVPYDPKYHAANIEYENHLLGIGLDLEKEEMEEMEEIEDTDADAEIPDTVADADSKWYTPTTWLSKARAWWKR